MIPLKEFYFLRHGQTDYNLQPYPVDNPPHVPLNATGLSQAKAIEPIIAELPIKAICHSPLLRAIQTKEIVASRLLVPHYEIPELEECNAHVWQEMPQLKEQALTSSNELVRRFVEQVLKGIQLSLAFDGPVLIVAHGGVHWALCSILNIEDHDWSTDNCIPIHFYLKDRKWMANKV